MSQRSNAIDAESETGNAEDHSQRPALHMDVRTHEPGVSEEEESDEIDGCEQCENHSRAGPDQSAHGDHKEIGHTS